MLPAAEPPDDFKIQPKVWFLGDPSAVLAYRRAREEPWFSAALNHAVAQFALRHHADPRPGLMSGAVLFAQEFANLSEPDQPWPSAYKPLRDESVKA
jgi:hypothetical protein